MFALLASTTLGQNEQFSTCPGNEALGNIHTCAQMLVSFQNSCQEVADEIAARAQGQDGWTDPHNRGQYELTGMEPDMVSTQRHTHYGDYLDKQTFALTPNGANGCVARMCSESQGVSADSGGTDMCDMFSLFCNTEARNPENGVQCKYVKYDLKYTIEQEDCGNWIGFLHMRHECQNRYTDCLKTPIVGGHANPPAPASKNSTAKTPANPELVATPEGLTGEWTGSGKAKDGGLTGTINFASDGTCSISLMGAPNGNVKCTGVKFMPGYSTSIPSVANMEFDVAQPACAKSLSNAAVHVRHATYDSKTGVLMMDTQVCDFGCWRVPVEFKKTNSLSAPTREDRYEIIVEE